MQFTNTLCMNKLIAIKTMHPNLFIMDSFMIHKQKKPKTIMCNAEQAKALQNILSLQLGEEKILIKIMEVQEISFIHWIQCSAGQSILSPSLSHNFPHNIIVLHYY